MRRVPANMHAEWMEVKRRNSRTKKRKTRTWKKTTQKTESEAGFGRTAICILCLTSANHREWIKNTLHFIIFGMGMRTNSGKDKQRLSAERRRSLCVPFIWFTHAHHGSESPARSMQIGKYLSRISCTTHLAAATRRHRTHTHTATSAHFEQ